MKTYSDSTLMRMTKKELIDYVRICEHNQMVAQETVDQQYKNMLPILTDITRSSIHPYCNKWILNDLVAPGIFCSNCGKVANYLVDFGPIYMNPHTDREVMITYYMSEHCPHCGATLR